MASDVNAVPFDVDGPRPAAAWVALLPTRWTTSRQRLLLLVLALDTYADVPPFTSRASTAELAAWTGEARRARLIATIRELEKPDEKAGRPALLEVEHGRGTRRSTYRLRVEAGSLQSARWNYNAGDSGPPGGTTSGPRSGRRSGPPGGTTPLPFPSSTHLSASTTDRAREPRCARCGARLTADGDCLANCTITIGAHA